MVEYFGLIVANKSELNDDGVEGWCRPAHRIYYLMSFNIVIPWIRNRAYIQMKMFSRNTTHFLLVSFLNQLINYMISKEENTDTHIYTHNFQSKSFLGFKASFITHQMVNNRQKENTFNSKTKSERQISTFKRNKKS